MNKKSQLIKITVLILLFQLQNLPLNGGTIEDLISADGASDEEIVVDNQARSLFEKGVQSFKDNNLLHAMQYAGLALKKDRRILLLDDHGMIPGIETYLHKTIEKRPDDATNYFKLAKVLVIQHKIKEAITSLEEVVKITPDSELGKKAELLLASAPGNKQPSEKSIKEQAKKEAAYEKEYAKLTGKSDALLNENSEIQQDNRAAEREREATFRNAQVTSGIMDELEEEERLDDLWSTLYWANPTNSWLRNSDYRRPTMKHYKDHPELYKARARTRSGGTTTGTRSTGTTRQNTAGRAGARSFR